jgi:glyoxylase-like metal-dependent hydrolase (beta-lactamase superfamily II)
MIEVKSFTFNDYQENTYLVIKDGKCIIIDPGNYYDDENIEIKKFIEENSLSPLFILITHVHIDHVLGIKYLADEYLIDTYIPKSEIDFHENMINYASMFGFDKYDHQNNVNLIDDSSKLTFLEIPIEILSLPGHSPGHLGFYFREDKLCFSGDVLFKNSIGRTDLPGGSYDVLIKSIKNKLFLLRDDDIVFPGHGPKTTIYEEKKNNPFLN